MMISQKQFVDYTYDVLKLVGANGCTVFPEGLIARFDDEQLEKLSNKMVNWVQKANADQKKRLHLASNCKSKLDLLLDKIVEDSKSVEDFEDELSLEEIVKLCNKVWNWWMHQKRMISADELEAGLSRSLGKFKREVEVRLLGDNLIGKDIEIGGIVFSAHAIERAKQRVEKLLGHRCIEVASSLYSGLVQAKDVECKWKYQAMQLLNHRFKKAKYKKSKHGMLYVLEGNVVKTVHWNESRRFR